MKRLIVNNHDPLSVESSAQAHVWAEKIALQLLRGNAEASHQLLDLALEELNKDEALEGLEATPIETVASVRVANAVRTIAGVATVHDLLQQTPEDLFTIPNFGPMSLIEVLTGCLKYTIRYVHELEAKLGL